MFYRNSIVMKMSKISRGGYYGTGKMMEIKERMTVISF